jgi:5'-methylthioadenosine phosphorylase
VSGRTVLGIIGGSGLYELEGLERARWESVESAFGVPSDALLFGELAGVDLVFLPRHGRGHVCRRPRSTIARTSTRSSAPASPI